MPALLLVLAGCGTAPVRPVGEGSEAYPLRDEDPTRRGTAAATAIDPCAPTRVHRDSDYTAGGLYAPGVADGGPALAIDVSALPEPVPRDEPRSRYGNRSPYTVLGKSYRVLDRAEGYRERGLASWYGTKFNGRATSSGELYDICQFTAAHKTLPLPSYARVTNLDNGRSLVVRVNDRGPFHAGRIMDLSYAAAVRLGVDRTGTARVEIEAVGPATANPTLARAAPPLAPPRGFEPVPPAPLNLQGERTVQIGSFADRDNARRLADRLRHANVEGVDMDRIEVAGRDLWRVRITSVAGEDVPVLLDRLRALGLPNARVFSE